MNILSIDIDYITSKYQNKINACGSNPQKKWEDVLQNLNNNYELLEVDYENLSFLMSVYIKALENSKKIIFAINHDTILRELEKNIYQNLKIINIDQHHDILYGNEHDLADLEKYNMVNLCLDLFLFENLNFDFSVFQ